MEPVVPGSGDDETEEWGIREYSPFPEGELWSRSSLGGRGAVELARMTPPELAASIAIRGTSSPSGSDLNVRAKLLRATAVTALEILNAARQSPQMPCWQCGASRLGEENLSDEDVLPTEQSRKPHLRGMVVMGATAY